MSQSSIGDLASVFRGQLTNTRIKADLQRLAVELASGKTSDIAAVTGGDLGNYAGIETAISSLGAYKISSSEASLFVETIQRSLQEIQDTTTALGPALLVASTSEDATLLQSTVTDARERFATVVSVLNTRIADRTLMAGTDVGGPAVADSETMLAELQIAIAGETDAAGVSAVVDAWFDDVGGGFETSGYLGGTTDLAAFRIGPNEEVSLSLRADHQGIRDVMKGYAIAALVADGALSGQLEERVALVSDAGARLMSSDYGLAELRASVGSVEARIETAAARNGAETSALEIARAKIVEVDPYKTATDLQSAEAQLEMLYTITARLSRLSLAEYLS